jgi:phenylalanyl-tRNA synthetase beta chain
MLLPINWLREYVAIELPDEPLADRLTMAGLEVEEIRRDAGETVFDLKITPNRGDWLSVLGVAREVAAVTGAARRAPESAVRADGSPAPGMTVTIEAPQLCTRYVARLVRAVRVGPSPEWVQQRLRAAGLRPINNVVDATNYVMLELGHPLHAFDYGTLREGRIVVRTARPGERITTIDGTEVALRPEMLVIADAERPVALAGVMGSLETEVSETTTDLLLEAAHFDPVSVRKTSKTIPLTSAASYRFERGVDPAGVRFAADRAAGLIVAWAGGEVSETVVDCHPIPVPEVRVRLRPERCRALLGMPVMNEEIQRHLEGLGLRAAQESDRWEFLIPSFRQDLRLEEDLIEEVGRIAGYERFPETLPVGPTQLGRLSPLGRLSRRLREQFLAQGLNEAICHTLTSRTFLERARLLISPAWPVASGESHGPVALRNPMSDEYDALRPSLLPGLLLAAIHNLNRGRQNIFLFEVGWAHARLDGPGERDRLLAAGLLLGSRWAGVWNAESALGRADFYDAKGVVEALAAEFDLGELSVERAEHPAFHPGRSANLAAGGCLLGAVGELHPEVAGALELPRGVYLFELDAQRLVADLDRLPRYRPPSRFPSVNRDLAVVVSREIPAEAIRDTIRAVDPFLIREVRLFDVYTGRPLPEDRVSLAFALQLSAEDRTLTDPEVDAVLGRAREALSRRFGAAFRG